MSKTAKDLIFSACIVMLFARLSQPEGKKVDPPSAPNGAEDVLKFCCRVAEAEYSAVPREQLLLRSTFDRVHSAVETAAVYWYGGEGQYIPKKPKEAKLHDAQHMTVQELMKNHGVSRSYAFQLKREARRRE